jgi:hypothetical protein
MPAKWEGQNDKLVLRPDRGTRLLDHNAGNWPEFPMEPGICAVLCLRPHFDFTTLDIIADRYQLACCLELAVRKGDKIKKLYLDDDGKFSFGGQLIGETVVFFRSDQVIPQKIEGFRGFADEFKRAYLSYPEGFEASTAHYGMVRYRLGSLNILLRHAANGYVAYDTINDDATPPPDVFATRPSARVTVTSGGVLVPHAAILELNTFSRKKKTIKNKKKAKKARKSWLSQSGFYVVAEFGGEEAKSGKWTDRRGTFAPDDIKFNRMTGEMPKWAGADRGTTQRFHDLLQDLVNRIRTLAAAGGGNTFMIEYRGEGMHIDVVPSEGIRGLSDELSERVKGSR